MPGFAKKSSQIFTGTGGVMDRSRSQDARVALRNEWNASGRVPMSFPGQGATRMRCAADPGSFQTRSS